MIAGALVLMAVAWTIVMAVWASDREERAGLLGAARGNIWLLIGWLAGIMAIIFALLETLGA